MKSPHIRALASLMIASCVPPVAQVFAGLPLRRHEVAQTIAGMAIWYLFTLPVVLPIGITAFCALRRWERKIFLLSPLIGAVAGALVALLLYRQGFSRSQLLHFVMLGLVTASAAAGFYGVLGRLYREP